MNRRTFLGALAAVFAALPIFGSRLRPNNEQTFCTLSFRYRELGDTEWKTHFVGVDAATARRLIDGREAALHDFLYRYPLRMTGWTQPHLAIGAPPLPEWR